MSDGEAIWVGLGYSAADAATLESIVRELVAGGSADSPETARRALAAVTFHPTAAEKGALAALRLRRRLAQAIRERLVA